MSFGGAMNARNNTTVHNGLSEQVLVTSFWGRWWDTLVMGTYGEMRKYSLLVLTLYGLAGSLVDLDHLFIQQTQRIRPIHLEYWFIVGIVCIGYNAYIYRCVHKSRMRNEK